MLSLVVFAFIGKKKFQLKCNVCLMWVLKIPVLGFCQDNRFQGHSWLLYCNICCFPLAFIFLISFKNLSLIITQSAILLESCLSHNPLLVLSVLLIWAFLLLYPLFQSALLSVLAHPPHPLSLG